MIENMVLASYLDKSYFVANIQMMSRDKLKHQVRGEFLSRDITFMSYRWYDVFLVCLPVKYCDMLHYFFCMRRVYYKTLIP